MLHFQVIFKISNIISVNSNGLLLVVFYCYYHLMCLSSIKDSNENFMECAFLKFKGFYGLLVITSATYRKEALK